MQKSVQRFSDVDKSSAPKYLHSESADKMAADIGSPYHLLFFFFLLMLPPQYLFDLLPLRLVQMGEVRHWRQGGSSACCGHHARVDLSSCIFKSRYRCYEYTRFNINIHRYIQSGQRKTALGILLTFYIFFFQFFCLDILTIKIEWFSFCQMTSS